MFYDFPRDFRELEPITGVLSRVVWGQDIMLAHTTVPPEFVYPSHSHPEEQMGIVLEGESEVTVGDETRLLKKGDMYHVPSSINHVIVTHSQRAVFLNIFSPPQKAYIARLEMEEKGGE